MPEESPEVTRAREKHPGGFALLTLYLRVGNVPAAAAARALDISDTRTLVTRIRKAGFSESRSGHKIVIKWRFFHDFLVQDAAEDDAQDAAEDD